MDIARLYRSARSGHPYDPRTGLTSAAWSALSRATACAGGVVTIGGEPHGLVKSVAGTWVLGIGEITPGGPTDPDVDGPTDPDAAT